MHMYTSRKMTDRSRATRANTSRSKRETQQSRAKIERRDTEDREKKNAGMPDRSVDYAAHICCSWWWCRS